jgi:hypothetical protein
MKTAAEEKGKIIAGALGLMMWLYFINKGEPTSQGCNFFSTRGV